MKRTSVSAIVILLVLGAGIAALVQAGLANAGRAIITPPLTLPLALCAIGAVVISLAVPIRRTTRRPPDRSGGRPREQGRPPVASAAAISRASAGPVDPFYATRVVMLAKACALGGALLSGAALGALVYLLSRAVVPGVGSTAAAVAGFLGALVLLVCGLVAESMCRIPPRDSDDDDADAPRVSAT